MRAFPAVRKATGVPGGARAASARRVTSGPRVAPGRSRGRRQAARRYRRPPRRPRPSSPHPPGRDEPPRCADTAAWPPRSALSAVLGPARRRRPNTPRATDPTGCRKTTPPTPVDELPEAGNPERGPHDCAQPGTPNHRPVAARRPDGPGPGRPAQHQDQERGSRRRGFDARRPASPPSSITDRRLDEIFIRTTKIFTRR